MYKQSLFLLILLSFSISCKKKTKKIVPIFKEILSEHSGIDFINQLSETQQLNIVNYIYYYNGGGVSAGDINNDGLVDLYFTSNLKPNQLFLNLGNLKFKNITKTAGVSGNGDWSLGTTFIDINQDGLLDIYVSNVSDIMGFKGANELFINNGDNTFTEQAAKYGLNIKGNCTQAYFFDFDNDTDLDVYIVKHAVHTPNSHGSTENRTKRIDQVGDVLLRNDNGLFKDVSEIANIYGGANSYGLSASLSDFNNDGWVDLYVCNDFHEDDYFYLNQKDGTFKEVLKEKFAFTSRFSMGSDAVDINNDGLTDIFTLDMLPEQLDILRTSDGDVNYNIENTLNKLGYNYQYSRNMLQINQDIAFDEIAQFSGIEATDWSWSPLFADFDLDGHKDLFISNGIPKRPNNLDFMNFIANAFKSKFPGDNSNRWLIESLKAMPSGKVPNKLYKGSDSLLFIDLNARGFIQKPTISSGAVYSDLDNDGDLDLVINNLNDEASILENTTTKNVNYISCKLNYKSGNLNGIGSKISIYQKEKVQHQELFSSRGFLSSLEPKIHFGLGSNSSIDSIKIKWPNGEFSTIKDIKANQEIVFSYDKLTKERETTNNIANNNYASEKVIFNHKEDNYIDWDYEKLTPFKTSTQGPAVAIDKTSKKTNYIYFGNASGNKNVIKKINGKNIKNIDIPSITNDSIYEDVDALFFDFNNDKKNDLYVVSGISQNKKFTKDRLYINEGNDVFSNKTDLIPDQLNANGSCVKACDFDKDGYLDLFIGIRSGEKYGEHQPSYLLKNQSGKKLTISQDLSNLNNVTDALWHDIDKDGWTDLIVASEWAPVKLFKNINGKLKIDESNALNSQYGMWQSLALIDYNLDGELDLFCGNWGKNNKLFKYLKSGINLYQADFNNNGKIESILTITDNGKDLPFLSKNIISSNFPEINKKYQYAKDYATAGMKDLFPNKINQVTKKKITTFSNGFFPIQNGEIKSFEALPNSFQTNSVNKAISVKRNGIDYLIAVGNQNHLHPNYGRMNSSHFILQPSNNKITKPYALFSNKKIFKKLNIVTIDEIDFLLASPNNDETELFKLNSLIK